MRVVADGEKAEAGHLVQSHSSIICVTTERYTAVFHFRKASSFDGLCVEKRRRRRATGYFGISKDREILPTSAEPIYE